MTPLGHMELTKMLRYFLGQHAMALLDQIRELTVYGTSRPRAVNKNAKTFRKQKQKQKGKCKTKTKTELKNKNKNENEKQKQKRK